MVDNRGQLGGQNLSEGGQWWTMVDIVQKQQILRNLLLKKLALISGSINVPKGMSGDIYRFIESQNPVSQQEIINRFSEVSERTVRRHLTDLFKSGLIKKTLIGRSTGYEPK